MSDKFTKYVPNIIYTTEFQGEKVVVNMEPLDRATFMLVQSKLAEHGVDSIEKARNVDLNTFTSVGSEVLKKCLKKIDGLTDAAGTAVTVDTVLDKMFFNTLVLDLFHELFTRATLGKASSSESGEKSPVSSTEQA